MEGPWVAKFGVCSIYWFWAIKKFQSRGQKWSLLLGLILIGLKQVIKYLKTIRAVKQLEPKIRRKSLQNLKLKNYIRNTIFFSISEIYNKIKFLTMSLVFAKLMVHNTVCSILLRQKFSAYLTVFSKAVNRNPRDRLTAYGFLIHTLKFVQ